MRVQNAGRKKGTPKTGGRQKGVPNHVTTSLRDAIMHAFDTVGGEAYLVRVARSNPTVFCTLLARILPLQLSSLGPGVQRGQPAPQAPAPSSAPPANGQSQLAALLARMQKSGQSQQGGGLLGNLLFGRQGIMGMFPQQIQQSGLIVVMKFRD
jgi:hypothetical protein